jgi:glycosyltransferase involved in cell wall biosynthesis
VATAVGSVPDLVAGAPAAKLVTPGDAGALAAAIVEQLDDRPGARTRALAFREAIVRRFGAERLALDMASLYRSLLARHEPKAAKEAVV